MTLSLGVELARLMLGSEAMFDALSRWAREPNPIFRRSLDDHLFQALESIAWDKLGTRRPEQLRLAIETLQCDPRALSHAGRDHQPRATLNLHKPMSRQSIGKPLFLAALTVLARRFLVTRGTDVNLRFDALSEFHHLVKHVECNQIQTFAWATGAHSDTPWLGTLGSEELRELARGPVLPLVADPLIESLADQGLAEVHRHFNGSASPLSLWPRLIERYHELAASNATTAGRRGGAVAMQSLDRQLAWLRVARWLRPALMARLAERKDRESDALPAWRSRVRARLAQNTNARRIQREPPYRRLLHTDVKRPLFMQGDLVGERALLYSLFTWIDCGQHITDVERAAVHAYLLVQNLILSSLIQPVEQHIGLARFVRDYSQSQARDVSEKDQVERLVQAYRTGKVRWLEARLSPSGSPADKVRRLQAAVAHRQAASPETPGILGRFRERRARNRKKTHEPSIPEVGVIFHFIRRVDASGNAEPSATHRFWRSSRHASLRQVTWQQAHGVVQALAHPKIGPWIVGMDIAGEEAMAPNEVFAPAMRFVRAATARRDHGPGSCLRGSGAGRDTPLRITCHAGEDFDHLIGGMRAVDEALEFLAMEPGDRIGHGLALGYDPRAWARACGGSLQHRAGPWLDDLVWFRSMLFGMARASDVLAEVESHIAELSAYIYDESRPPAPELLQRAWCWRSEDPVIARDYGARSTMTLLPNSGRRFALRCLQARGYDSDLPDVKLWHAYDQNPRVRDRYQASVIVPLPERWLDAMVHVQERMLAKLVRLRVAIEINPSSNTSVGLLRDLSEHPVFRWHGPGEQRDDTPFIVVGSDDPGIFATELLHEYAFLACTAAKRGASPRAIKRWIEDLRQTSIDFCFVPDTMRSAGR